jgi:hypothetical protein
MALWILALANALGLAFCWWLIRQAFRRHLNHVQGTHELEQKRLADLDNSLSNRIEAVSRHQMTAIENLSKRIQAIEDTLTKTELPQPEPPLFIGAFAPTDEQAALIETRIREAEDHSLSATVVSPVPNSSVRSSRSASRSRTGPWMPGVSRFGKR